MIGRMGTILGEHKVNIANFALGREHRTDKAEALAVIQIDGAIPPAALTTLEKADGIKQVQVVKLAAS